MHARTRWILWVCVWSIATCSWARPQGRAASERIEALERLARWIARYDGEVSGPATQRENLELDALLVEISSLSARAPERRIELASALLDLGALRPRSAREPLASYAADSRTLALRRRGLGLLTQIEFHARGAAFLGELSASVLADARTSPLGRRVALLEWLEGRHEDATLSALLSCSLDDDAALRRSALRALGGWPSEAVHLRMAAELERGMTARENPWNAIPSSVWRHFERVRLAPESPACKPLRTFLTRGAFSADWRTATRALEIGAALPDVDCVPVLIQALEVWTQRRENGEGSARIEAEVVAALEERAGLRIGAHPDRWRTWWLARANDSKRPIALGNDPTATRASFFGLRPATDRVIFVIDRSGSMDEIFGTAKASRFAEALRQLQNFLAQLGPKTRFGVILFSDRQWMWKQSLVEASPANLASLRGWLNGHRPGGGTELRPAIARALALDVDGAFDPARTEADTVIVLCDGATAEGAGWVVPWFDRVGQRSCIAFHCVQIGLSGDGALEALAEESGGRFVAIH